MVQSLKLIGWLACVVYSTIPSFWFMVHPFVKRWRKRKRSPYLVLLPAWLALWVLLATITLHWRNRVFYSTQWGWLPAILLFVVGLWLYLQSANNFTAQQLGGIPELLPDHREQRLVTSGIRGRVRHPVYLAHFCEILAWSLGTGLAVCYALTGWAMLTGLLMIRMEDHELEVRFGDEYREYCQRVPALLPRI